MELRKIKEVYWKPNLAVAWIIVFAFHVASSSVLGQTVISPTTIVSASTGTQIILSGAFDNQSAVADFSNISLKLSSTSAQNLITATPITVNGIELNGSGVYTLNGEWTISRSLVLNNGILKVDAAASNPGILIYAGTNDITTGSATSYVDGLLTMHAYGSGPRSFPIGNSSGYFPVRLEAVTDNLITLDFEVIDGDPGLTNPGGVLDIFKDHYWQLTGAGTFSGSIISLSSNNTDAFFNADPTGGPAIVEKDTDGKVTSLDGDLQTPFITSKSPASSKGTIFAIAKGTGEIKPVIVNVITPNEDGTNDYLSIKNIEFFADNEVSILDRYGVPIWSKENFANYANGDEAKVDFDFSKLSNGNYICTLKYGREGKKLAQMITILK